MGASPAVGKFNESTYAKIFESKAYGVFDDYYRKADKVKRDVEVPGAQNAYTTIATQFKYRPRDDPKEKEVTVKGTPFWLTDPAAAGGKNKASKFYDQWPKDSEGAKKNPKKF